MVFLGSPDCPNPYPFIGLATQCSALAVIQPHCVRWIEGGQEYLLAIYRLRGKARTVLLVPALYGLAFVWETRLIQEPSVTRMLILGILLVLTMNYRPQGLLGKRWVHKA